jgi:predicted regulator of amino acid metabolism with ACT domain
VTESPLFNEYLAKALAERVGEIEAKMRAEGLSVGEAKGRVKEARLAVLKVAAKRFGAAPTTVEAAINAINDCERLERIIDRILDAADWNDLLTTL